MVTGVIALAVPGSTAFAGEFLILTGVFDTGWGWAVVGAIAIVLAAMYMLRLISAVLHEREGSAVRSDARDLRLVELAVLVPLVALPARAVRLAGGGHRPQLRADAGRPGAREPPGAVRVMLAAIRHARGRLVRARAAARPARRQLRLRAGGSAAARELEAARGRAHRRRLVRRSRHHRRLPLRRQRHSREHRRRCRRPRPAGLVHRPAHLRDRPAGCRRGLAARLSPAPGRVLRAAPGDCRRHGLPRPGDEPHDALPRASSGSRSRSTSSARTTSA